MTLGTLQRALIEGVVEDPSLARKIASAGRVYSGIAAADTNATAAHTRLDDPVLLGKYQLDLGVQSVVGALALANLPPIPQTKLNAITDPSKLVSATLGVLQNASANQSGYAGFQSAVGANLLAAWTVVAGRAIIAQATIQDGHVANLSANKLSAGAINTGTINILSQLTAGQTTIDSTGIKIASVGSFGDPANSNRSSKITSVPGGSDTQTFGAFGFALAPASFLRGSLLIAHGVAGAAVDGLIRLAATTAPAASLSDAASAYVDIRSVSGSQGRANVYASLFAMQTATTLGLLSVQGGAAFNSLGTFNNGLTLNANLLNNGYRVAPAYLSPIINQGGGGTPVDYNHGLGSVPLHVTCRYSGVGSVYWRTAGEFGDGASVNVQGMDTNIVTIRNNTGLTQQIQIVVWA